MALRGDVSDGHAHVAAALAKGAAGAMVHAVPAGVAADAPLLRVVDTRVGLAELGAFARVRNGGRVIAVTGSVGKTTTKEMLRLCLGAQGPVHAAEASHNNHWGVPLTLARLAADVAACVVEIGMNHAGEIAPLARLASPHVAVITTVAAAHIGHLGSLEAIADEKGSIARGLVPDGVMVLPADLALLPRLRAAAGRHRVVTFGAAEGADARLTGVRLAADHSEVSAVVNGRRLGFRLGVPGRHMVMNALATLLAVEAAGFDAARAAAAMEGFVAGAGRGAMRPVAVADGGGNALLLDESYNASAVSVRAALAVLALQPAERRIAVLGDMLELGDASVAEHRGLAADAAAMDLVFTCGPQMRALFEALPASRRGAHADNAEALAPLVRQALRQGDALLVKGSNGSRMRVVVAALDGAWGDLVEARQGQGLCPHLSKYGTPAEETSQTPFTGGRATGPMRGLQ